MAATLPSAAGPRHIAVTLPSHCRYIAVPARLHCRYIAVTLPLVQVHVTEQTRAYLAATTSKAAKEEHLDGELMQLTDLPLTSPDLPLTSPDLSDLPLTSPDLP